MSYDNHDKQDPNRGTYAKSEAKLTHEDLLNGKAIETFIMAGTMSLMDFMKWFKENQK